MASQGSTDIKPSPPSGISRRNLLRGSLIAGGAVLGATAFPGIASAARQSAAPTPTTGAPPAASSGLVFFTDPNLDFNARFAVGAAGYGSAEVGEAITAINAANAADGGTIVSFVDAFRALADKTEAYALESHKAGDTITAREAHLRAAEYSAQVLFFILGTATPADEPAMYAKVRSNWEAYGKLADTPIIKVAIPYGKTTIPAYLMRPDDSGKGRPTVIINNGSDAQTVETFAYGGAAAIERGYNALLFEGPGQGAMLFERKIPFRYDWEKVITPIVDWLEKRPDVDKKKIVLTGWSLGGELVARAAAYEHRLAAVVADPGFADNWLAWPPFIRQIADSGDAAAQNAAWTNDIVPGMTGDDAFTVKKRAEIYAPQFLEQAREGKVLTDFALLATTVKQFRCLDVVGRIKCPTMVTTYELDTLAAGQAQPVYDAIKAPKQLQQFTVAQGAQFHCAPMAPQYRNEVVFDWLDDTLGRKSAGKA